MSGNNMDEMDARGQSKQVTFPRSSRLASEDVCADAQPKICMSMTLSPSTQKTVPWFLPHTIKVQELHYRLYQHMQAMHQGCQMHVECPHLRHVMEIIHRPHPFKNSTLLCCKSIVPGNPVDAAFALVSNSNRETDITKYRLIAVFHVFQDQTQATHIKTVTLPYAFCNIVKVNGTGEGTEFTSIMRQLGISAADTDMGPDKSVELLEEYREHYRRSGAVRSREGDGSGNSTKKVLASCPEEVAAGDVHPPHVRHKHAKNSGLCLGIGGVITSLHVQFNRWKPCEDKTHMTVKVHPILKSVQQSVGGGGAGLPRASLGDTAVAALQSSKYVTEMPSVSEAMGFTRDEMVFEPCIVQMECSTIEEQHRTLLSQTVKTAGKNLDVCNPNAQGKLYGPGQEKTGIREVYSLDCRFVMVFEIIHATRIVCSIYELGTVSSDTKMTLGRSGGTGHIMREFVTSTSINFSGEIVYADVCAKDVFGVFGLRSIATRLGKTLKQNNITNEVIVQHLRVIPDGLRSLLSLMSTTDMLSDMHYVMNNSSDNNINTFCKLKASLQRVGGAHVNVTQLRHLEHSHFQYHNTQHEKTVTCNKKNRNKTLPMDSVSRATFLIDPLITQKMVSARGVAILRLLDATHRIDPTRRGRMHTVNEKCMLFPKVGIPRLISVNTVSLLQQPQRSHEGAVFHEPLDVHAIIHQNTNHPKKAENDAVELEKNRRKWQYRITDHNSHTTKGCFSHTYVDGEVCLFQHKEATFYSLCMENRRDHFKDTRVDIPETTHLVAVFESPTHAPRESLPFDTNVNQKGALVTNLLELAESNHPLYTRAMAHMVLISAYNDCVAKNTAYCDRTTYTDPSNYYRTQFLQNRTASSSAPYAASDRVECPGRGIYEEYSLFTQCLKNLTTGTIIPHDMFSLLVAQGLPFPET